MLVCRVATEGVVQQQGTWVGTGRQGSDGGRLGVWACGCNVATGIEGVVIDDGAIGMQLAKDGGALGGI
ncbi:hypothetical protein B1218_37580, partial [Pseudomonas ogarae]